MNDSLQRSLLRREVSLFCEIGYCYSRSSPTPNWDLYLRCGKTAYGFLPRDVTNICAQSHIGARSQLEFRPGTDDGEAGRGRLFWMHHLPTFLQIAWNSEKL